MLLKFVGTRRRGVFGAAALVLVWLACSAAASAATISGVEGTAIGGQLASFSEQCPPATYVSSTITWGDGSTSAGTFSSSNFWYVSGTHTYARYGTYSGSVSLMMDCNGNSYTPTPVPFTATVTDAALSATGVAVSAAPGQTFSSTVAQLVDANPEGVASDDIATVNWGDGTTSAGTLVATSAGHFNVTGSHSYAAAGIYGISVSIVSSGGSSASATTTATIISAPVILTPVVNLPPVVKASFAVSGTPGAGYVNLSASASAPAGTTATHYDWSLASAPGQDIVCPGSEPNVELHVPAGVNTAIAGCRAL